MMKLYIPGSAMKRNTLRKRRTMSHLNHVGHQGLASKNQPILTKRHKLSFGGIPHANLCHKCPFRGIPNTLTDGHAEAFGGAICVSKGALVSLSRKLETTRHLELE